jgi:hypothetical protein
MAKLENIDGHPDRAAGILEDLEKSEPKWLDPHVELASVYYKLKRPGDGDREREIVHRIEAEQQQQPNRDK